MMIFKPWKTRLLAAALSAAVLLLPVYVEMRTAGALNVQPPVETIEKADVALEETKDIQKGAEKANVLFLLDTGSSMTFTPLGTLPEMANAHTGVTGNATPAQAALMLAQATYGHGGLPLVGNNADRYGRDLDQTNNMKTNDTNIDNHPNDYYSPFDYENNPVAAAYSMGNVKLPYALVFKHSKKNWWQNGPPAGTSISVNDLVPNDSRMYKMKLVMWKILEEKMLLENLRFGMATTYQDTNTGIYSADFYKVSPYGAGNQYYTYAFNAATGKLNTNHLPGRVNFPNGTGPDWATGLPNPPAYNDSVNARWGIDREWYWEQKTTMRWRLVNRAYLRVPIKEYSAEHVDQFRLWIDGFEDVTTGVAGAQYYYKNPELFGDGKTFLSTAIYSGHPSLSRTTLLAQKDVKNVPGIAFSQVSAATETSIMASTFLNFKAGSGEAVGSVLDFFSPPVATTTQGMSTVPSPGSAHNVFKAPPSSFPLIDECEKNWLVIFTAGDDSSEYSSAAAVKALYEYTRDNQLTKLKQRTTGANNSNNTFEPIKLDDGIRTLVVGFVDKDSNDPNVVTLRKRLNDMAKAGDPGNDAAEAFFANDVKGLIDAMRKVLARINREIQPEEGSMLEGDSLDGDMLNEYDSTKEEMFNLYGASYRVNIYDQWEGKVSRYLVAKDNTTGELRMDHDAEPKWEVGDKLLSRRNSSPVSAARDLVFWKGAGNGGKNYEALEYTELNASGYRNPHPDVTSYNINLAPPIASMDNTILGGGNTNWNQRMHPSRALVNWYYGYEVSYGHSS